MLPPFLRGASGHACRAARPRGRGSPASPFEALRPWVCAIAAFAAPLALLWLGDAEALEIRAAAFGAAGLILLVFGEAPVWAVVLAALPLLQLAPGKPPSSLAGAMAAAGVEGPGTLALDPSALWSTLLVFAGCLAVFSLARAAGRRSASAAWWAAAAVAAFGCFEAATGARAADAATGTLVNRGQFAAMLEITFGVGCGLAAASWAGRSWRERFEERALLGGILGIACAASSLAGIALSLSRTGIAVGALAAFAAVLWLSRRRALMIAAAAVALLGLTLAAPPTLDRAHARFEQLAAQGGDPGRAAVWADSASLARQRLAFGAGLGSFPTAFRRSSFYLPRKSIEHAHSDYLEWLVELGAPGAALLLCSLIVCLGAAARRASGNPLAAGCVLGVGAVLVHAAVDLPLQHPGVAALAAAAAGLAAGLTSFGEKELRKPGVSTLSVGNAIARVYQRSFPLRNRAAGVNPRSAGPKPPAPLTGSGHETGSSAAGTRDPATLDADVKYGRRGFTPAARLRSRKGLWFSRRPFGKRRSKRRNSTAGPRPARESRTSRLSGAMLGLAVAALAAFLISGKIETPQQLYAAAGEASARGDSSAAERLYAQVLDRNLFTAPAWLRLAELERARGNEDRAGLFFQAARTVEPYTLRTEWPLAELELASGDAPAGARRLAGIVSAAPDLLDVALHSAWRSGAEPGQLEQIVPRNDPEAAGRYLAFLTRNRLDVPLPEAYARLGRPGLPQPYRDWLAREAGFRP